MVDREKSRLPSYYIMCFPRVQKIGCYRCLRKPQDLKGFTENLVLGLLNNVPVFRFFAFLWDEFLWISLTFYGINFKITNLDLF